jgi:Protoglobin
MLSAGQIRRVCLSAYPIPLRYIIAFVYPITATIKPFLAKGGHDPEEVDKMYNAWFKSVVMQVALWAYPYAKEGEH